MGKIAARYGKPDAPLAGYAALLATYGTLLVGFLGWRARTHARSPSPGRLLLYAIATHKIARILTRDQVAAPLRAPFVRVERRAGRGEVVERARGHGIRRAVGQLLTCPFCTGPWVAGTLLAGDAAAPQATRFVASVFAVVTGADLLTRASARLDAGKAR